MPRLPEVTDRNALPEDKRHIYDYLAETRGSVRLPFSVILNNPEICYRVSHVGSYVRFDSSLSDKIRELAIIATAREFDVRYEWAAHARLAQEHGVSAETVDIIANKKPIDGLSEEEALPVRMAHQLLRDHRVSDDTWKAAVVKYGEQGALELVTTVGYYGMLGCLLNCMEIEPAADAMQLPSLK